MLDHVLNKIFSCQESIVVGFGFDSDKTMFRAYCPNLTFIENTKRVVQMQQLFQELYPEGGCSLAAVCEHVLSMKLCKNEQMSNWELRPLRQSQLHYAAADAWVLTQIAAELHKQIGDEVFEAHLSGLKAASLQGAADDGTGTK